MIILSPLIRGDRIYDVASAIYLTETIGVLANE
nr:MAG TPA: hypothetical protein [Caudoviricetes sp.]